MTLFFRTAFMFLFMCNSLSAQLADTSKIRSNLSSMNATECNDPVFLKYYGRLLNTDYGRDIVSTPTNGSITVGYAGNTGQKTGALVFCLDINGNLLWKKQWSFGTNGNSFSRVLRLIDGNYIAMGRAESASNMSLIWLVKFDINGTLIFSKYIPLPGGIGTWGHDICETMDGGFAIAGGKQTVANISESIVMRLNKDADVSWVVNSDNPLLNSGKTFTGIIEHEGNLVVAGYISKPSLDKDGLIFKLNSANGTLIWQNQYDIDNMVIRFDAIHEKNGTYFVDASRTINQSFDGLQQCIMQINPDGSVKNAFRIDPSLPSSFEFHSLLPLNDGGFITTQSEGTGSRDLLLFKISSSGTIEWKKKYTQTNYQQIFRLKPSPDNGVIGVGIMNYASSCCTPEVLVLKTNALGELGQCISYDHPLKIVTPVYTSSASNIILNKFSLISVSAIIAFSDIGLQTNTLCYANTSLCSVTEIVGPVKVCSFQDTVEFYARRSADCLTPVKWEKKDEYFRVVASTDSTIKVIFLKTGVVLIQAKLDNNCNASFKELAVKINESPGKVNLGPDLKICPLNSLYINAGSGFEKYLWSNGNTDSMILVNNPGRYSVTVNDFCGITYIDEIEIEKTDEYFSLGPDRSVCDRDTIILRLPGSYTVASWLPDYNISLLGNDVVIVSPLKDTDYIISSLIYPGCLKSDTVRVFVKNHLPLMLGKDTSICVGQSFVFTASPGFVNYLWSDNSIGPSVTVTNRNSYWLQATAPNGCVSRDTVSITEVHPNPVINLGKQIKICEGTEFTINAGNYFLKYQWQDGSSLNSFIANKTGKYWVDVIDRNGCFGTDTAFITDFLPAPKGFLDKNELREICINGRPLELSSLGTWKSYLWSNRASSTSILVRSPGVYWLEVTNESNCLSRDSIFVHEKANCLQGLNFPNVFTPNGDGKNDLFKAIYSVMPESFLLQIFDRFGGKVFETGNPEQGWSGKINGKEAGSGSFAWYCKYNFRGGQTQLAKGTITIIK